MPASPDDSHPPSESVYNRLFWLTFAAHLLVTTSNTLTYRFAEFVRFLGGTEELTGQIIGFGLMGALVCRLFLLGQLMDRFGIRAVWAACSVAYVTGGLLLVTSNGLGILLFVARALFAIGLAGMVSATMTYIQILAPAHRRTEMLASLGTAGLLALLFGAQLGDLVVALFPEGKTLYAALFGVVTLLGAGSGVIGLCMPGRSPHPHVVAAPATYRLFLHYWPPLATVIAAMTGLVTALTTIFLTRYSTSLGLNAIGIFFSAYGIIAVAMRLVVGRWSRRVGRHRLIIYGLAGYTAGAFALLGVSRDWHFLFSALLIGGAQAISYPCLVSLGAGSFPRQSRGTGTTICLAIVDLSTMLIAPALGWIIDNYGFQPMLIACGTTLLSSTVLYAARTWHTIDEETLPRVRQPAPDSQLKAGAEIPVPVLSE